ncbi:AMP-binding protein [Roseovarius sp.]|uniref:class I adenylate-forming enzyme family protein n=1 Tax=Roseovarius sp. TaxID=1486281 RepID=UPI00260C0297|nr:AMP-binding protein [Roseovarius sp.]MDM8168181.1 AMP-binding protein [Roseovarius sp.]
MNIGQWLMRTAQMRGGEAAIYLGAEPVADYAGFHDRAARLAGWLGAQGIGPGDRVGIFMKNCPEFLIAFYGVWYAGAVAVPINAKLHGREAAWILGHSGAKMCFATPDLAGALDEADVEAAVVDVTGGAFAGAMEAEPVAGPAPRELDDLAWLFYTSGTTGRPKGVMITHRMLIATSLTYLASVDPVTPADATLYAAPMSHGAGLYAPVHVLMGARHVCPASGGFEPGEIFDLAKRLGNLHLFAAPTMVKRMTQAAKAAGYGGEGLRSVVYGGGPMYVADIVEAVEVFGPVFVQIYGQGEAPMGISALSREEVADRTHPRWRERLGSVGRAQAGVEVRIGDAEGAPRAVGEPGEIMVRGDVVMRGYWENPEGTAKTLKDGWLMTGDIGTMDADGFVTLQDRSKDVIISGGTNIYPREVEECLLMHGTVSEVSVVGRPDPEWGEDVVAFVVCEGALDEAALDAHCREHIARFKRPKAYFAVPDLPKNNYGKVLKTELRKRLEEGAGG